MHRTLLMSLFLLSLFFRFYASLTLTDVPANAIAQGGIRNLTGRKRNLYQTVCIQVLFHSTPGSNKRQSFGLGFMFT